MRRFEGTEGNKYNIKWSTQNVRRKVKTSLGFPISHFELNQQSFTEFAWHDPSEKKLTQDILSTIKIFEQKRTQYVLLVSTFQILN